MKLLLVYTITLIAMLEVFALKMGHNGAMFASSIGAITALVGYKFGKHKRKEGNND